MAYSMPLRRLSGIYKAINCSQATRGLRSDRDRKRQRDQLPTTHLVSLKEMGSPNKNKLIHCRGVSRESRESNEVGMIQFDCRRQVVKEGAISRIAQFLRPSELVNEIFLDIGPAPADVVLSRSTPA